MMGTFVPDTFLARRKGDVVTQQELQGLVGCGPRDSRYSLRVCQLADALMTLKRQSGEPCTIAQVKSELRFLTDAEASRYNAGLNNQAVKRIRTSNRRLTEVKVDAFTEAQRSEHDRRLAVSGARVALTSASMVNRLAKLGPHERVLPTARTYRSRRG
jgi:hypothetical protein